tara:strand:+ start:4534 stop:4833 length:300 start_codon:yes stop_codon:yes gene_type:complete
MPILFLEISQNILLTLISLFLTSKKMKMKKEYKVEIIKEGALGTLLFGSSKLPLKKMIEVMNKYGEEGWDISFQLIEKHRLLLFWSREAVIITFSRNKQ